MEIQEKVEQLSFLFSEIYPFRLFFAIAWEQQRLGDVAEGFTYGLNSSSKPFDGKYKYLRITDIDDSSHNFLDDNMTSPSYLPENSDEYVLKKNDLLFARTGASVGKTYKYKEKDGIVYYAGYLIRARINTNNDPDFIFQKTLSDEYQSFVRLTSQRSGQPGINAEEYKSWSFMTPKLKEQQKVGKLFETFDSFLTLRQREVEKLKEIKKGLLQKLFV